MSTLLIHTKFALPLLRRRQISRPHLVRKLATLLEPGMKLGLVAAPPGFGKTSLLAEWASQTPGQVAWLALDAGDNEPLRFWDYVITALQRVRPGLGAQSLAMLHEPTPPSLSAIVGMLLNEVSETPDPLILVLDDYHVLATESIHQAISFLMDHLPPQMRLILGTRVEPPLPLARLRVQDAIVELRAADLRFSANEAASLLAQVPGLTLDGAEVALLERRTEGWAAGLQIAALALHNRSDTREFVQSFAGNHRFVLDYLTDEVLERQPLTVQQFLLQTSILGRLNAGLCAWVTGQDKAQAQLEELDRANLFVVPLDETREWYRYHQLFADFLHYQLQQRAPEQVAALHRRASIWFAHQGLMIEAVAHALAAQDYAQAADLIESVVELLLWRRPELYTLHAWLTALPESIFSARPRLRLTLAWVFYLTNRMPAADQLAQAVATQLAAEPGGADDLSLGMLAAIQSSLVGIRRQFAQAGERARFALDHLPPRAISWRCIAAINLGVTCVALGSIAEAQVYLSDAMELSQEIGSSFAMLSAFWHLASLQVGELQLAPAEATCLQLSALVQEPEVALFAVEGYTALLQGEIDLERNDLESAEHHLLRSVEEINAEGFPMALLRSHVALARLHAALDDPAGEAAWLAQAEALVQRHHLQTRTGPLMLLRAFMAVLQGDLALLERWVTEQELAVDAAFPPYQAPVYRIFVGYLLLKARIASDPAARHQACELSLRLVEQAETTQREGSLVAALVVAALAHAQAGQPALAVEMLARAVALAEPERCVRVFADHGRAMADLLGQLVEVQRQGKLPAMRPIAAAYLQTLLAACGGHTMRGAPAANQALFEPLSERELEVLRLLAEDLSSNDIAARLIIAVETARKHIKNIYGKLDAHSRLEAVRRAEQLGLL